MADIDARCISAADGWLALVTVAEHGTETRHSVTFTRADFQRLARNDESPEQLIRRTFEFLLAREPKESILASFALSDIGRYYFPEYEREFARVG